MKVQPSITIAGEPFEDLADSLSEWSVTRFQSGRIRVVAESGDVAFAPWARAIARYVDELTTAGIGDDLEDLHAMAFHRIMQEMTAVMDAADSG